MISTCSAQTVPHAWVAQTRPGGIIVTRGHYLRKQRPTPPDRQRQWRPRRVPHRRLGHLHA
ncbi:MAG: hypothetical protein ACRDSH_12785, partial [Pseudonocardiaceae bacterium]